MLSKKRTSWVVAAAIGIFSIGVFAAPSAKADGFYRLQNFGNQLHADGCLDVYNGGIGPWIQMWECHSGNNQWFELKSVPGFTDSFYIRSIINDSQGRERCIDGYAGLGEQLRLEICSRSATQTWWFRSVGSNQYIITNHHNRLVMDQRDYGQSVAVQLWTDLGSLHQRWYKSIN